jgi:hypothetical protein
MIILRIVLVHLELFLKVEISKMIQISGNHDNKSEHIRGDVVDAKILSPLLR